LLNERTKLLPSNVNFQSPKPNGLFFGEQSQATHGVGMKAPVISSGFIKLIFFIYDILFYTHPLACEATLNEYPAYYGQLA